MASWNEEIMYYEMKDHLFGQNVILLVELLQISLQTEPVLVAWGRVLVGQLPLDSEVGVSLYRAPKPGKVKDKVSQLINILM